MWATSVANVLLVLTLPALAAAITMLLLDRRVNSGYYSVDHGGEPVLYQHLFWFFGYRYCLIISFAIVVVVIYISFAIVVVVISISLYIVVVVDISV